jgi:hypothetical protein
MNTELISLHKSLLDTVKANSGATFRGIEE